MMKINITKRLNRFLAVAGAMLIGALPALAQESSLTRVAANVWCTRCTAFFGKRRELYDAFGGERQ